MAGVREAFVSWEQGHNWGQINSFMNCGKECVVLANTVTFWANLSSLACVLSHLIFILSSQKQISVYPQFFHWHLSPLAHLM